MKSSKKKTEAVILPDGKKELTQTVIKNDFFQQKNSFLYYFLEVLWIGAIFAFSYFLSPACFLCLIPAVLLFIKEIRKDIRRRKLKFYVIERPCIKKDIYESNEDPDSYRLWFLNKEEDYNVSVTVEKEYYDATEIGDEFYVTFSVGEKLPCLWYRKSEWKLNENSFSARR